MTGIQGTARTVTRRTVVAAAGVAGLSAALVACGDSDAPADSVGSGQTAADGDNDGDSDGDEATDGDKAANGSAAAGSPLGKTSDIPEGGGKVFEKQGVVVTQPNSGEFKAFSSICTHQGCSVKSVSDGIIHCPCHGSEFSAADGSVKGGPASRPLPAKQIKVEGDSITLA